MLWPKLGLIDVFFSLENMRIFLNNFRLKLRKDKSYKPIIWAYSKLRYFLEYRKNITIA